ncbi:MAG TPA: polysaccharide deacetylase family protein [Candidatus Saccharimonadaceae bacterium]|nr:polysaccharide deacetylase family protein [Candidatus Saccharimonadaceae bacterium]
MSGRALRWMWSLAHRSNVAGGPRLVIVRHHRVYGNGERPLYRLGVSERVLDAQLALLAARGLAPLTVSDGLAWLAGARSGRRVAMTFDDGYRDNVERALPLLERHGARATFYLTAGLIEERRAPWWDRLTWLLEHAAAPNASWEVEGRILALDVRDRAGRARALAALLPLLRVPPDLMERRLHELGGTLRVRDEAPCDLATWDECRAFVECGMELGAHTLSHPFLTTLSAERQQAEITGSVERIAARLAVRPRGLAYPGGDHDAASVAAAARAGLEHAVTTRRGDVTPGAGRYELLRRGLSDGACLGPTGAFSRSLALAELDGAFDRLRGAEAAS